MKRLNKYTPTHKANLSQTQINSFVEDVQYPLGYLLFDRYEIIRTIKGGMGIIYIVRDKILGWYYATKTLYSLNPNLESKKLERFIAEIELLIEIPPHLNLVQTDFIKFINNRPYIFMEYINGTDLRKELFKTENRGLNFDVAIDFALQICDGMQFIHEEVRILHLDLKPENILIDKEKVIKISDFGISRSLSLTKKISQLAGTYFYMSPEQIKGKAVNICSDIYSFGIIFYEMLTGKLPYPHEITSIISENALKQKLLEFHNSQYDFHDQFPHLNDIVGLPSQIKNIVRHCLSKIQSKRVPSFMYLKRFIENDFSKYKIIRNQKTQKTNFHRKGLNLQLIGKHSDALEYFNHALQENPLNVHLWNDAANSFLALRMEKEEKMCREKAKQLQ